MTATATSRATGPAPRVATRRRAVRPKLRLLLPPVPEPELRPDVANVVAFLSPALTSVRSPVTESPWPVAARRSVDEARPVPDPDAICGPLVVAALEALAGVRPVAQLTRWVSPQVYDALAARVDNLGPGPVRRATLRRTRVCRLDDRVAEASVVVHDGTRVRAAAVRLELRRGQWRATVLQIG